MSATEEGDEAVAVESLSFSNLCSINPTTEEEEDTKKKVIILKSSDEAVAVKSMSTTTDEVTPAATTDDVAIPVAATDEALPTAATDDVALPTAATDEALPTAATTEEAKKKKVIILKSSDDETFEVDEAVAVKSQTIKHMIEDGCADNGIPLPNVDSEILTKVIEYCKKHVEAEAQPKGGEGERTIEKELRKFDSDFVKVEQAMLFDLILAANYLDIKSLLDLVSQTVANMIKDKSPEEVRVFFNIKNDFTPEEEEAVRNENPWAFE